MMKSKIAHSGFVLLALTTFGSAVNYLCQILIGRFFSVELFGITNTIFSFITVLAVMGNSLNQMLTKVSAENASFPAKITAALRSGLVVVGLFFVGVAALMLLGARLMEQILTVDSPLTLFLIALCIGSGCLPLLASGALSGLKRFLYVGVVSLFVPMFKLLGILWAYLQGAHQVDIILLCMTLGALCAFAFSAVALRRYGVFREGGKTSLAEAVSFFGRSGLVILFVNILFTFLSNADILFLNAYLGNSVSGIYSASMLFGRIVYFVVTALVTLMLPSVVTAASRGEAPQKHLYRTFLYTGLISFLCFVPILLAPSFFLNLIYGEGYLEAAGYLPFSFAISLLMSLLHITFTYLIGVGRARKLLAPAAVVVVGLLAGVGLFHRSGTQVLGILIGCLLLMLCATLFLSLWRGKASKPQGEADAT